MKNHPSSALRLRRGRGLCRPGPLLLPSLGPSTLCLFPRHQLTPRASAAAPLCSLRAAPFSLLPVLPAGLVWSFQAQLGTLSLHPDGAMSLSDAPSALGLTSAPSLPALCVRHPSPQNEGSPGSTPASPDSSRAPSRASPVLGCAAAWRNVWPGGSCLLDVGLPETLSREFPLWLSG